MHTYIPERETGHGEAWGDGEDGEQREGERTTEHTRETRERGRRRKGRGQCEPEALKYMYTYTMHIWSEMVPDTSQNLPAWLLPYISQSPSKTLIG